MIELLAIRLACQKTAVKSLVICLLSSVICSAEDFPDPTRPPAYIFAAGAGTGIVGAGGSREVTGNSSTGLRTIIISETRRAAIIDGKIVELGGEHGDARLIEVNESGVVLQHPNRRQVLTLFPDVKITRNEMPGKVSAKMELPDNPAKVKPPSAASKSKSHIHRTKPTAHKEEK